MIYDINLIPRAKKKASNESVLLMTILGICLISVTLYFGVYIPINEKTSLEKQISVQEKELENFKKLEDTYLELLDQKVSIYATIATLDFIQDNKFEMTKIINYLEKEMPKAITLDKITLSGSVLNVEGTANSYREIAQFIIKLRKMDNVTNVTFLSAQAVDNESIQDEQQNFTIKVEIVNYDTLDQIINEAQNAGSTIQEEEAVSGEAN